MERSEFKERLRQYKQAREENPGLKYWEWKDIPKYDEGGRVTLKEKEDAFWRGDAQKMAELVEREGKQLTYVTPESNLNEVVVTAKDLKKEKQRNQEYNNLLDLGITAAGFVPGLGEVADAIDVVNQLRHGNYGNALTSTAALLLPGVPASALRKGIDWLDETSLSGNVIEKIKKLYNKGANAINFDPNEHFSKRLTVDQKYDNRDVERLAQHMEEYKELESEIMNNPEMLKEFYNRLEIIKDPGATLQTFSDNFKPWRLPDQEFYTGVPEKYLPTFHNYDGHHLWMSTSPSVVSSFSGKRGGKAMLTTLNDLDEVVIDAKGKPYYQLTFNDNYPMTSDDIAWELYDNKNNGAVRINNVIEGPDINILPDGSFEDAGRISNDLVILKGRPVKSIHGNTGDFSMWFPNEKYYAEGGEVNNPPTYEQWYEDITRPKLNVFDDAQFQINMKEAAADLHNMAMELPGYADKWNEYMKHRPKEAPQIDQFVDDLWQNENPKNVGYKKGKYYPHKSPEGGAATIGPGFKIGSGSHRITEKEANKGVTRARLDREAARVGQQHLDAVNQFLNHGQTTNPADTVSPQIKMGLMDLRHQVGPLNGWHNLRNAVLEGDLDRIKKESTVTWEDNGKTRVDTRRKKIRDNKYFHY